MPGRITRLLSAFQNAKMPGKITRLLSAGGTDYLATEDGIPTHVSPEYKSAPGDVYTPYNKPFSIMRWLEEAPPTEDVVVVVDPDCLFVGKLDTVVEEGSPLDIVVEEGSPVAQQAFYNFDFSLKNDAAIESWEAFYNFDFSLKNDAAMEVAKRYCVNCTFVDPIAVPIIIHRRDLMKVAPRWPAKTREIRSNIKVRDLMKIAPRWLAKTREIRADRANWPNHWNNRTASKVIPTLWSKSA
ncbi:hypothetical protein T484DRAFT_1763382 [Baffinella frigidus]|nr:hypothetical protein T484DRAFT_1763382 [Cryptophyta sp. CCMP2293]